MKEVESWHLSRSVLKDLTGKKYGRLSVIRVMANDGFTHKRIGELFECSRATIGLIMNNKRWVDC